jgi:hypothetical protein
MPAKDIYHDEVKNALIKEGWFITDDPLSIQFGGIDLYVDLGAEKLIAAKKDEQQIAVEVKSFQSASLTSEFHTTVGQYINYRIAIENEKLNYTLYLAIPLETYNSFFQRQLPQTVIQRYHFKLVIYDIETQEIVKWIN